MIYQGHDWGRTIKCSCGNEMPARWAKEGKIGLKVNTEKGIKKVEKYCVNCASNDEYETLLTKFNAFINFK